jgi:hypothetical protein
MLSLIMLSVISVFILGVFMAECRGSGFKTLNCRWEAESSMWTVSKLGSFIRWCNEYYKVYSLNQNMLFDWSLINYSIFHYQNM